MTLSENINQHMTISEEIDQIIADNGGRARDAVNVLMARLKLANQIIEAKDEYIKLLGEELNDVVPMAHIYHWRSDPMRIAKGVELREKIYKLTQQ